MLWFTQFINNGTYSSKTFSASLSYQYHNFSRTFIYIHSYLFPGASEHGFGSFMWRNAGSMEAVQWSKVCIVVLSLYKQKRYMKILNLSSDFVIFQGSDFVRGGGCELQHLWPEVPWIWDQISESCCDCYQKNSDTNCKHSQAEWEAGTYYVCCIFNIECSQPLPLRSQ